MFVQTNQITNRIEECFDSLAFKFESNPSEVQDKKVERSAILKTYYFISAFSSYMGTINGHMTLAPPSTTMLAPVT
jgi:hypothetical protein